MIHYFKFLFFMVYIVSVFGFLLPFCISANSTIIVLMGLAILFFFTPLFTWVMYREEIKKFLGMDE